MKMWTRANTKGITLIELMVTLVISGIVIAGIYRVFIAQTRAYSVQDQVVEVQQNVRGTMELLLRDLRMAGHDDDHPNSAITINNPILHPVDDDSITLNYEYWNPTSGAYELRTVFYGLTGADLFRRQDIDGTLGSSQPLLQNVAEIHFRYGEDSDDDGTVDTWREYDTVTADMKVIAVSVRLTARPDPANVDAQKMVSPRTLESIVILRNLCLNRQE